MTKITVTLTAVMNDGKVVRQPGERVSLEEKQAMKLASLGMVKLPKAVVKAAAPPAKNGKAAKQTPPPPPPDDDGFDDDSGMGETDQNGKADERE